MNNDEAVATDATGWQDQLDHLLSAVHSKDASAILKFTTPLLQLPETTPTSSNKKKNLLPPLTVLLTIAKIHCRAHISLQQYSNVLEFCRQSPLGMRLRAHLIFEESYALYKLGRYSQCRDRLLVLQQQQLQQQQTQGSVHAVEKEYELGKSDLTYFSQHLMAQCQYRMLDTQGASQTYQESFLQHVEEESLLPSLEFQTETLVNAAATHMFNATSNGSSSRTLENNRLLEQVEQRLNQLIAIRTGGASDQSMEQEEHDFLESMSVSCLHELMYNYGTLLLMNSSGIRQTQEAQHWLEAAEKECISYYDVIFSEQQDGSGSDDETKEQEHESILANHLAPIQANLALAKLLAGDERNATRSYLELVLQSRKAAASNQTQTTNPGALLAAETNLTVLQSRNTSSSSMDLLTRLPTLDALESQGGGTITPNQIRTLLYNRALLYCRMKKIAECKTVLDALSKSISSGMEGTSKSAGGSAAQKKKRKKKLDAALGGAETRSAPTETEAERLLWKTRIAMVNFELTKNGKKSTEDSGDAGLSDEWESLFQSEYQEIKEAVEKEKQTEDSTSEETLEYALAELKLFAIQSKYPSGNENAKIKELEGLPSSIQSRPATVATLSALYKSVGEEEKVEELLDSALDSELARKSLADFKLNLGLYEEAAQIYESIVNGDSGANALAEDEIMECKAALVKALSYFDTERAVALASELSLNEEVLNDDVDGEELEAMNVPRLSKAPGKGISRIQKIIGAHAPSNQEEKKRQNKEAILKKRARRKEAYLLKLQKEGKYNPDRPVQPDPERWIPKTQRSYTKRGRRGRNKFVGAQGGGSGAGAEKDAAKLDVAARAAARAAGTETANQQPSTAHLSVSSSGKGGKRR